jgi:GNAT superfamily N-acetyltransferase
MDEPTIRRAGSADAQALAEIGAATFTETFGHLYPPEDLSAFLAESHSARAARANLADPRRAIWLMEAGGRAIGYAHAGPCALPHPAVTPRCGELKGFYLAGPWQGRGLGERLFATALAWLESPGARDLWIGVWSENHGAQRFYARHGFEKVGNYNFRVGNTLDDEFILRRPAHNFSI